MSLDSTELLLEHHVEESSVELSDPGRGSSHVHGVLTSTQHDVLEERTDGGGVNRSLRLVGFQHLQGVSIPQNRRGVLNRKYFINVI